MIKSFYTGLLARSTANADNPDVKKRAAYLSPKFIIKLVVSVGILTLLLLGLPTDKLFEAIGTIPVSIWLVVVAGFIVGHIVSALKWRLMLRATGTTVTAGRAIRAHGAGLFANLCLPSIVGGDFVRAALVVREQRGNLAPIALGSLADRINDTLALTIIAGSASLMLPEAPLSRVADILGFIAVALLLGAVVGIAAVRLVPESRVPSPLRGLIGKIHRALDTLFASPGIALAGLLLSIVIQGSFAGLNVLLAQAMHIDAPAVLWLFAWPMAKLVALAPVSLGGIGVREVAIAGILAPFGIEASLAVAQSLCWEVVLVFSGLLAGLVVAWLPTRSAGTESTTD